MSQITPIEALARVAPPGFFASLSPAERAVLPYAIAALPMSEAPWNRPASPTVADDLRDLAAVLRRIANRLDGLP